VVPKNPSGRHFAEKLFRLLEKLEDLDDVQKVYANFEGIGRGDGTTGADGSLNDSGR
jgi:hypothetical protein